MRFWNPVLTKTPALFFSICFIALCFFIISATLFAQGSDTVELLGSMNQRSLFRYNDCWGYTGPDGREYALLGVRNGTSIIDITEPGDLKEIAFFQTVNSPWKDIKTYQHYAYVVTDQNGSGMQIIDLSGLPDSVKVATTYRGNGFRVSHNIHIDAPNAMLYAVGEFGEETRAISLADPVNPVEVSSFGGESHDIYARDNIVYVSEGSRGTFGIYDLNDAQNPKFLARIAVPGGGYAHNCWLSDDGHYLMTTEETLNRTVKYWDIRDLNDIKLVGTYLASDRLAHNAHIKGKYAYISHYTDGLRIVDLSDPANLEEVGHYDTFLGSSTNPFDGAWGAFPFFESGKILISDITTGLYVVKFTPITTDVSDSSPAPEDFELQQNYPNPFNPNTVISFQLPVSSVVSLKIFNQLGQEVLKLIDAHQPAGQYRVEWDGRNTSGQPVPGGIYFFKMTASRNDFAFTDIKKGILLK